MKKHPRDSDRPSGHSARQERPVNQQRIVFGTFYEKNGQAFVLANNVEHLVVDIKRDVPLPIEKDTTVKALVRGEGKGGKPRVLVLRALGPKLSLKHRIMKLVEEAAVPTDFRGSATAEAESYGHQIAKSDFANRRDLTDLPLCTIDGESAKDFDDAVFATQKGRNIQVIVAIADVSHYVKKDSVLDEDAILRGTSIYFPGNCIPMLPETLSNGLCSLKPNVKRLAIAVTFEIGPLGGISRPVIEQVVIKSAARLTYNEVQNFYDAIPSSSLPQKIQMSLEDLQTAAHILRKARERRGAIDFDVMESVVALDDIGEPIAIHPQDRLDAHRIIEDLMVATNEIVADFFQKKQLPCLYRVHEPPDQEKLANFLKTGHAFGVFSAQTKTSDMDFTDPKAIQKLMAQYQKSKYQDTLNNLMLRSMMQARYSDKNLMHFGLASKAYLHFTSPIRRYADLIVHRQLRYFLFEQQPAKKMSDTAMAAIAETISHKEVRATDLERKIDRVYSATFMVGKVGETFEASIVAATDFGLFVRIAPHHVEGLVHIATISRSHVDYIPEKMALVVSGSNMRYMVGDKVMVRLINVNIDRGHVDFELVKEDEQREHKPPSRRKRSRKPSQGRGLK